MNDSQYKLVIFVSDLGDLLSEVDINPLTVVPTGAVVVDALMLPR